MQADAFPTQLPNIQCESALLSWFYLCFFKDDQPPGLGFSCWPKHGSATPGPNPGPSSRLLPKLPDISVPSSNRSQMGYLPSCVQSSANKFRLLVRAQALRWTFGLLFQAAISWQLLRCSDSASQQILRRAPHRQAWFYASWSAVLISISSEWSSHLLDKTNIVVHFKNKQKRFFYAVVTHRYRWVHSSQ